MRITRSPHRTLVRQQRCPSVLVVIWCACLLSLAGCSLIYDSVGGAFNHQPHQLLEGADEPTLDLLDRAFAGVDPDRFADAHVHMVTPRIHASWRSWMHPIRRMRTEVFRSAAAIDWDDDDLETNHFHRLMDQVEHFPIAPLVFLYAMDSYHDAAGERIPDLQTMYVPNDIVVHIAEQHPDRIVPVVSIHPARIDALEMLHHWADRGCRFLKWLPNSMGIDPSDERHASFYEAMRERGMVLLSHTGDEHAIEAADQSLGNPLLLRTPLEHGVTVVALHAGSHGHFSDFDCPDGSRAHGFDLFIRMMDDKRYEGLFFGEISAVTFYNHLDRPLSTLLEREDLHARLINGSDYPVCAVNVVIRTSTLRRLGFITSDERRLLNDIYKHNPLLFDFLVKRTVRHPKTGQTFSAEAFHLPEELLGPATVFARQHAE